MRDIFKNYTIMGYKVCAPELFACFGEFSSQIIIVSNQGPLKVDSEEVISDTLMLLEFASFSQRPDLIGRDVPAVTAAGDHISAWKSRFVHSISEKQQNWLDKLTEFCQVINYGNTGKAPYIPLQVFGLLDSAKSKGYYKVTMN